MAESHAHGVIDANCRVFRTHNLHIAGSSVFSASGAVNPTLTLTLTALALHLGEHLTKLS